MKSRIKKNSWLQDITPSEYTVGIIKCTVRFLLILYLFYESILPAIVLFPLWFLYMKEWMEEKAIGKDISDETIINVKTGLMGPMDNGRGT